MGRIEEIKETLRLVKHTAMWVDESEYEEDVEYLLYRLQIAEEKLKFLAHNSNRFSYTLSEIEKFAKEALEQIQKEE